MPADEDVFNATSKTLKIFESSDYFGKKKNILFSESEDLEYDIDLLNSSLIGDSLVLKSPDVSDLEKNIYEDKKLNYNEFKTTVEKIALVYEMYKHHLQQINKFQEEGGIPFIQDYCADIMDASNVSQKIGQIKSVVNHIKIIAMEGAKLKQVLRSNVLNDVWKINKDYHKAVVQFFKLSSELVSHCEIFVHSLEHSKRYNPENRAIFLNKEMKILAMLNENMDLLADFQNYVQKYYPEQKLF